MSEQPAPTPRSSGDAEIDWDEGENLALPQLRRVRKLRRKPGQLSQRRVVFCRLYPKYIS